MILAGDNVRVFPHGHHEQAAVGKVLLCSENQRAIMVAFDDAPAFVRIFGGLLLHPEHGAIFMASRKAVGPWVQTFQDGHYEIETADVHTAGWQGEPHIHCIRCGATSYNLNDVKELYCGNCHRFHERTAVR